MPTARWRRSSTRPAGSLAAPRLRPRPWGGGPGQLGRALGPVAKLGSKAPAATEPGWPGLCAPTAWRSSRLPDPTAGPAAGWASPTRSTPRRPLEPPCPGGRHPPRPVRPARDDPGAGVARRGARTARVAAGGQPRELVDAARSNGPASGAVQTTRRWPGPAWPGDQDHGAIPGRPPRRPWGAWPGAGTTCSGTGRPGGRAHQAGQHGRTSAVARPALAWTPPGSCWCLPATTRGGWAARLPSLGRGVAPLPASSGGPTVTGSTGAGWPPQPWLVAHRPGPQALP